jgi:hypothetical protein
MERWGGANNPVVKAVAVFAVALFLAVNLPAAFYAGVAATLSYATVLLAATYSYRKGYGIVGRPELMVRFAAKTLVGLQEECSRTVGCGWERRQKRKRLQRERKANLRRYRRERNRKRRKQARKALTGQG